MRKPEIRSDSVPKLSQNNGSNFFSSGLRQKVDQLMNVLYAGGVNNPMDSIEQLSYLIFLRLLSERDEQAARIEKGYQRIFSGDWARYAWDNFVTLTGNELFDTLRGAIEKLHELPSLSQTGKMLFRNATLKIYDRPTLRAVVQIIADMDLAPHEGRDLKGDMYEYLLSKLSQSGTNGQFRTPRHIIDLIVALVGPQPGLRICDPACGTAGFLISSYTHILRQHTKPSDLARGNVDGSLLKPKQWEFLESHAFTGFDNDANMVKIAILNLYLHQLERARIEHHNPLTTTQGGQYPGTKYDVILANPPFAGRVQKESILADINLDTRDTELLFLKWFLDHLTDHGRTGVIVPNGVLFGSGKADRKVRQLFLALKGTDFASESAIVRFLEEAHNVIADYDVPGFEDFYRRLLSDAVRKFNLRYRLDEPFTLRFLLPGSFNNLYAELHRLNTGNGHLAGLLTDFEKAFDRCARTQDPADLRICIGNASKYVEGLAGATCGKAGSLGELCKEIKDWPHVAVQAALSNLYGFCSDYPGIRHAGNPKGVRRDLATRDMTLASLLLLSFSGYLSPSVDERAVLGL